MALLCVACGGASSGLPTPTPEPAADTAIASTAYALVNDAREAADLPALVPDSALAEVATAYSCRMAAEDFFSHTDPSGAAVDARMVAAGVAYLKVGENLARIENAEDPAGTAVDGWLESPTHAENIFRAEFKTAGMGVCGDGAIYYFTQVFVEAE